MFWMMSRIRAWNLLESATSSVVHHPLALGGGSMVGRMFWMMSRILAWNLLESATSSVVHHPLTLGVHGGPHVLDDV